MRELTESMNFIADATTGVMNSPAATAVGGAITAVGVLRTMAYFFRGIDDAFASRDRLREQRSASNDMNGKITDMLNAALKQAADERNQDRADREAMRLTLSAVVTAMQSLQKTCEAGFADKGARS